MTQPDRCTRILGPGRLARLLALTAMLGCGHTEPFRAPTFETDQPFDPGPPVRLTLNRGADRRVAWLSDGSAVLYSTQLLDRPDNDVCLATLPSGGGRQTALTCDLSSNGGRLTDALESAAPAADGRLAYVAATSGIGAVTPESQNLVLASVLDPATRRSLIRIPYTTAGGRLHGGLSQLRWFGPSRLVYLGESVTILRPCQFCPLDTLRSGLDVMVLDADGASSPQAIPGTDFASGVSPGSSEDEVFYTLGGDSRVYRRFLSSGAVDVVHDFGTAGIARDVHVIGNRMAAVVGGKVIFGNDPALGPTQSDSGGILHVVDFKDGSDLILDAPGLFRRPQLSPSGSAVIAEVYPLIITFPSPGIVDTAVSKVGDLYLLGQP